MSDGAAGGDDGTRRPRLTSRALMSAFIAFGPIYLGTVRTGMAGGTRFVVVAAVALVVGVVMDRFIEALGGGAAAAIMRLTGASGSEGARTPFDHSHLQAMVERGETGAALREFEAALAERPDDFALRLKVADLHARRGGDARRAESLLREGRTIATAPGVACTPAARDATIFATQRLIDLYEGPLDDRGRALVELRRLIETFPGSREATAARATLARWKGEQREEMVAPPEAEGGNV